MYHMKMDCNDKLALNNYLEAQYNEKVVKKYNKNKIKKGRRKRPTKYTVPAVAKIDIPQQIEPVNPNSDAEKVRNALNNVASLSDREAYANPTLQQYRTDYQLGILQTKLKKLLGEPLTT